jgi:zinc and cadmium transporter
MLTWGASLLSVVVVSLVSLVGIMSLSLAEDRLRKIALVLVSFAVGALLGDAFIHLLPAAFGGAHHHDGHEHHHELEPSLLVLGGMLLFFVVEKLLRHIHGPIYRHHHPDGEPKPTLAAINVIGDAIHNFIDGVLIAASYLVSPTLGVSTTIAVLLHEIPQELGDFGILVHSGLSVRRALLINLASASFSILGAVVTMLVGETAGESLTHVLVPITAGGFVYIASANLIPELQHDHSRKGLVVQVGLISAGVAVMAALTAFE